MRKGYTAILANGRVMRFNKHKQLVMFEEHMLGTPWQVVKIIEHQFRKVKEMKASKCRLNL